MLIFKKWVKWFFNLFFYLFFNNFICWFCFFDSFSFSIFNDFFSNEWLMRNNATAPAINVFECEKRYTVEVAAPGMTKDDFAINLNSENNLTISMEKNRYL